MRKSELVAIAVVALLFAGSVNSQEVDTPELDPNPLQSFERLIGGQWHLEGSYQELEWGVGQQSVRARSYFVIDGESKLVSEGAWYWHPGEQQIKGLFTATNMPVVLFEYATRFEGDVMINDLTTYAANGNKTVFKETWQLVDESHFEWTLTSTLDDGSEPMMSGTYSRRPSPSK